MRAESIDEPWAVPVLEDAARQALRDGRVVSAVGYLKLAWQICADDRHRAKIMTTMLRAGWRINPSTSSGYLPDLTAAMQNGFLRSGDALVLTKALLGEVTGAVACTVSREPALRGDDATEALLRGLKLDWGVSRESVDPATTGLTLDVADRRQGWRYAHWLVSHADDHGVQRVRFDDQEWTAAEGSWRATDGEGTPRAVVAEVFTDS